MVTFEFVFSIENVKQPRKTIEASDKLEAISKFRNAFPDAEIISFSPI